jgi:hypothetical protein
MIQKIDSRSQDVIRRLGQRCSMSSGIGPVEWNPEKIGTVTPTMMARMRIAQPGTTAHPRTKIPVPSFGYTVLLALVNPPFRSLFARG